MTNSGSSKAASRRPHETAECASLKLDEVSRKRHSKTYTEIKVHTNPSVGGLVTLHVVHPPKTNTKPRSTLYFMPGMHGGKDKNYVANSEMLTFFKDKGVNAVAFEGGAFSSYSDWSYEDDKVPLLAKMLNDPTYGAGCWSTLVGRVVPEYIDRNFHGKGTGDVVSGLSNTGRAAPVIAATYPQRFRAAGLYSAFPETESTYGRLMWDITPQVGSSTSRTMWGAFKGETWRENNPYRRLPTLARHDVKLYVGAGNGKLGPVDKYEKAAVSDMADFYPAEILSRSMSARFASTARKRGVDVHSDFLDHGVHDWGLFNYEIKSSWNNVYRHVVHAAR